MSGYKAVGLIDNLQNIDQLVLQEGYEAPSARYMAAVGGNTGNLAFVHGTRKCIGDKIIRVGWGWPTDQIRSKVDALVISCANQIGAHVDLGGWADAIVRHDLPVVLVGLGAQTPNYEEEVPIPPGTMRFLEEVTRRRPGSAPNIAVRGEFTRKVLAGVGIESQAIGCPSLFISPDAGLGGTVAAKSHASLGPRRVAVAAGNPFHPANRKVESIMVALCNQYRGAYVVQHPEALVALALGRKPEDDGKLQVIAKSLGFGGSEECVAWFGNNAYVFHESTVWMHFLRHFDVVIGPRYHGVAFAVQAGVPGMTVNIDNRTRELSDSACIPSIGVEDVAEKAPEALARMAVWSLEQGRDFDENRVQRAGLMADFLRDNSFQVSDHLEALARPTALSN